MRKRDLRKEVGLCLAAVILILMLGGCATILKGTSRDLRINSNPPGAEVYVDDSFEGTTPTTVKLKASKIHRISLKQDGYQSQDTIVFNRVNPVWVCIDLFLLYIPAAIDAATGAWYELNPAMIYAELKEEE
jgi:hypothetical protein